MSNSLSGCWTEHYYYTEIAKLTELEMNGHLNAEGVKQAQKEIKEMFDIIWLDGYSLDGGEPSDAVWEVMECGEAHASCYEEYGLQFVNGKMVDL